MKKTKLALAMLGVVLSIYSCKNEVDIDTPSITSYQTAEVAYMGDSIPLAITAQGEHPLSSIKVTFLRNGEQISDNLIPINQSGTYTQKLLVPYVKDMEDGEAEIQIMVTNKNFDRSKVIVPIQVSRPIFPYLTLKTAYGDYRMEPVDGEPYKYEVTENFPATKLNALIEAPAYGANGNAFYFGSNPITANASDQDSIPFQTDLAPGTAYTVSFDTRSYEAEPFLKTSFGGYPIPAFTDGIAVLEEEFVQDQAIEIRGLLDIADWWINPTFLTKQPDGTYTFRAMDGKYRVTADQTLKYFKIEPMNGNVLADFDPVTKTGGVYINGGARTDNGGAPPERLGIPSMESNPTLWNPEKNIAMAPMGGGIYEIVLVAGQTLFQSNVQSNTVGIGFYHKSRSMDDYFALDLVQTLYGTGNNMSPDASAGSARFELQTRSGTPVVSSFSNRNLSAGKAFLFTLDTNVSPAAVSISVY